MEREIEVERCGKEKGKEGERERESECMRWNILSPRSESRHVY
jgi:hypothetical protein